MAFRGGEAIDPVGVVTSAVGLKVVKATSPSRKYPAVLLTCAELLQPGIGRFVEDPNLRRLVLLLQQKPHQVLSQEAGASGDEVDEARLRVRHAATLRLQPALAQNLPPGNSLAGAVNAARLTRCSSGFYARGGRA